MRSIAFMCIVIAIASCNPSKQLKTSEKGNIAELKKWMVGSYDSHLQAEKDSTYYNISLHMYPIWQNEKGHWLYVEQALAARQESPYRQRVYELIAKDDGSFISKVYKLPNEKDCIGQWRSPAYFDQYKPADLIERAGCGVILSKKAQSYSGSTNAKDCGSTLRGATYATSIVDVYPNKIVSWDQGFDAQDEQVWGARKGGYEFLKLK